MVSLCTNKEGKNQEIKELVYSVLSVEFENGAKAMKATVVIKGNNISHLCRRS
jgi:hypothetical protein